MDSGKIWSMFEDFNRKYFWSKLNKVRLSWSPRMTLCAGKTAYKVRKRTGSSCSIRLSQPLLSQRPHEDTVNTLLHEMIHAYLHVTQGLNYRDSHGPEFRSHMNRINALQGSKITIYHNFRKEVDKFRIHVYRCDGPCVSRRPFFGILRRAIERPPGPTDKWWARHNQECGGTFRKIEGPGAVSPGDREAVRNNVRLHSPEKSTSPFKPNSRLEHSSNKMNRNKRNHLKDAKRSGNFNEDAVLKRIRDKYGSVKQTILLSKEESETLSKISCQDSKYAHLAPFGNYVEGKINYNYRGHSPNQVKIAKYLNRYREVNKEPESPLSQSSRKSLQEQNCGIASSSTSRELDSRVASGNFNATPHRKARYPHAAPFGNYVKGKIDYNYRVHTPHQIKIAKYLNRYREVNKEWESPLLHSSRKSLPYPHVCDMSSSSISRKLNSISKSTGSESKVDFNCLYQSKTPDKIKLDKYLKRYQATNSSFLQDSKSFPHRSSVSIKSAKTLRVELGMPCRKEETMAYPGSSKTTLCPVCSVSVPISEYDKHLGECFADDLDFDIDVPEGGKDMSSNLNSHHHRKDSQPPQQNFWDDLCAAKNCSNCGSKVLVAEMKLHLQYCIDSDDDTDSIESPQKLSSQGSKDEVKHTSDYFDDSFVSCPSCMEKVKEENIQQHLDECLQFISEEF